VIDESVENCGRAEKRHLQSVGSLGSGARDHAVVFAGQRGDAEASQVVDGRLGCARVCGGVSDDEFDRTAADSAGTVDVMGAELETGEQMLTGLHPARPGERYEDADAD
jgi:hypothetical protein